MSEYTIENKACLWCGLSFPATRPDNVYCSHNCASRSSKARNDRLRAKRGEEVLPIRHSSHSATDGIEQLDMVSWQQKARASEHRLAQSKYAVRLPERFHANNV